ncbi:MAG: energy-coupled thiamine transporter ThiT [Firmicutes bacterium]|nr:energy-coupled thiamine transporter ThiT [Bacillota bacterium]
MDKNKTRLIAQVGVAVALATVLQYVKIMQLPQGGSVSLQSVPIIVMALLYGPKVGMLVGGIFGLVEVLLDSYVIHPIQFLLDYPVPFMVLGLAGLWANKKVLSIGFAYCLRYLAHILSGVVFFGEYAPAGTNVWLYSIMYNGSYLIPEAVLTAIVSIWLWRQLQKRGFSELAQ